MRLFEAIMEANHRAAGGDAAAGLHPADFADSLPVVALTCIDPRLNPLIPEVLGVREEQFIWLRNAGNIITGPLSSTMRSLALACAVKGGKEIAVLGHTDCLLCKTTVLQLTERFRALGVDRTRLPENLNEYFGLFASERQNAIRAAEIVRSSPLIGSKVPVHGLVVDITTGKLEWLINGYQTLGAAPAGVPLPEQPFSPASSPLAAFPELNAGELKFPQFKIGETPMSAAASPATPEADGPAQEATPQPTAPVREPAKSATFQLDRTRKYRVIGTDRITYGPVTGAGVMQWIADGRIDWQTLAKPEGGAEWRPLSEWAVSSGPSPIPVPPRIAGLGMPPR